jgi:predicted small lipoprotein YifL
MRMFIQILLVLSLALPITACGNKGRLKSPTQIEEEAAKKAARDAKEAKKKQAEEQTPAKETAPAESK